MTRRALAPAAAVLALAWLSPAVAWCGESSDHDEDAVPAPRHAPPFTVSAAAFFGDGLRFNDPYRLATVLGSSAESVSRTAAYVDVAGAITFGDARRFQHGVALHLTLAVEGVQQTILSPGYVLYRRWHDVAAYARAGTPLVCSPEVTWGLEGALGGIVWVRAGVGVGLEIVGDVYYGAGTREVSAAAYPVLSGQLGVTIAYEVLP